MALWKLLPGGPYNHKTEDGERVVIQPGGTVESDENLAEKFQNRFEEVPQPPRRRKAEVEADDEDEEDTPEEAPVSKKKSKVVPGKKGKGPKSEVSDGTADNDETDEDFFGNEPDQDKKSSSTQVEKAEAMHTRAKADHDGDEEDEATSKPSKTAKPEAAPAKKAKKIGKKSKKS